MGARLHARVAAPIRQATLIDRLVSHTHARRRGGQALKRLHDGDWPPPSTVIDMYGTWAAAVADAFTDS